MYGNCNLQYRKAGRVRGFELDELGFIEEKLQEKECSFSRKRTKKLLIGGNYTIPRKLFQRLGTNDFSMISKNLICYILSGIIAFACSITV